MRKSEPSAVNEAICDMLEALHSAGKIDSETYREQLAQHGGLDRLPPQLSAADFKAIRQKLSVSQRQLAELIHVSLSSVVKWESGKNRIPATIALLMGILNKNGLAVLSV